MASIEQEGASTAGQPLTRVERRRARVRQRILRVAEALVESRGVDAVTIEEITEAGVWQNPIVTELVALDRFYAAEEYHQQYYELNQNQPYCRAVIAPKVAKLRQKFQEKLKKKE